MKEVVIRQTELDLIIIPTKGSSRLAELALNETVVELKVIVGRVPVETLKATNDEGFITEPEQS